MAAKPRGPVPAENPAELFQRRRAGFGSLAEGAQFIRRAGVVAGMAHEQRQGAACIARAWGNRQHRWRRQGMIQLKPIAFARDKPALCLR